jgi:hypothetical protein
MRSILSVVDQLSWGIVLILCGTLGLAPFTPPHIIEKVSMLIQGNLVKPLDWFDLLFHGVPWILLFLKILAYGIKKK